MARRSTLGRRRGHGTAAPPAIKVAPIKLDAGLAQAYEWMAVDRPLGLRLATDWYATNVAKLLRLNPPDADRQTAYGKALKSKSLGDNPAATEGERAAAWFQTLRLFEKVFPGMGLPTLVEAEKAVGSDPTPRVRNVKTVLDNLNAAFGPVGIKYQVRATDEREFNEGTVWVPQAELEAMVAQPPLKLALAEAGTVAQVLSIRTVEGNAQVDGAALLTNVPLVLNAMYAWAEGQGGGSLVKPVGRIAKAGPKGPRAPRQPYVPTPGGSTYVPKAGTKSYLIYEMLKRPGGASVKEMSEAVKFQAGATVSEFRKKGMNVEKLQNGNFHLVTP